MSSEHDLDQKKIRAQSLFAYGNDAAMKGNLDYAIDMYRNACKLVPDELIFRQALRGVERRKFSNEPKNVGRMVGAKIQPIRLRIKTARAKSHWAQMLEVCEEVFVQSPWDVSTTRDAAEAAEELGFLRTAQWLYESVQAQVEKDAGFFRAAAAIHQKNEDWQKAIFCWEKVKQIDPNDETANRHVNSLSASATIKRSGLGEALRKQEDQGSSIGPDQAELDELKKPKSTPEDRYLAEIREDPTRVGPYLHLAEHYKSKDLMDEAEKILSQGLKAAPTDEFLRGAHAEVQLTRLRRAVEGWARRLRKTPDDAEAKAKHQQLSQMLNEYERKDLKRRIAARPDDMSLQLQMGQILARAGRHDDAIAAFQQARNTPNLKVQALHAMGQSFEANGALKLAERTYQEAIKAAEPADRTTLNALHYRLGRVAESNGQLEMAEDHYNEVAASDYTYLDVAVRLKNLNQKPSS
jgi:tetratricopeptide (TPR) repeat protein